MVDPRFAVHGGTEGILPALVRRPKSRTGGRTPKGSGAMLRGVQAWSAPVDGSGCRSVGAAFQA